MAVSVGRIATVNIYQGQGVGEVLIWLALGIPLNTITFLLKQEQLWRFFDGGKLLFVG
jgi:hypothetical protein